MAEIIPPFSTRNHGAHLQVDSDFPASARMALIHLLHRLVDLNYISDGWIGLAREVERIARAKPSIYYLNYSPDIAAARQRTQNLLSEIPWDRVLDLCERLVDVLASDVSGRFGDAKPYIANEIQRIFLEEGLAFEFRDGLVQRRGRRHTSTQVSRAQIVLGDAQLESARKHFNKGLRYFQEVAQPDYENAVKEAVCAVEATARALFQDSGLKNLSDIIKSITGAESGKLPKAIAQTFQGLYGFRSGGEGVAHGGATGGQASRNLAEYVLAVAASQIILLVDLANREEDDVPF